MKILKRILLKSFLVISGVMSAIILVEIILRMTPYKYLIVPPVGNREEVKKENGYYIPDDESGYDIGINRPKILINYPNDATNLDLFSNELGCRDIPYKGETEPILLIGDSFIYGNLALFEESFGVNLEKLIGIRVLKCGVGGYGTRQEYNKAKKILKKINTKPGLIIVGYFEGNDFQDDLVYPNSKVLDGYLVAYKILWDIKRGEIHTFTEDELRKRKEIALNPGIWVQIKMWLKSHSVIYAILKESDPLKRILYKLGIVDKPAPIDTNRVPFIPEEELPWLKVAWEKHLTNIKSLKSLAEEHNSKFLLILIPLKENIYAFRRPKNILSEYKYDFDYPRKRILDFCKKENLDCFDLTPHFREYAKQEKHILDGKKDLYWMYDGHWGPMGQKIAALLVAKHILQKELIDVDNRAEKLSSIESELSRLKENLK